MAKGLFTVFQDAPTTTITASTSTSTSTSTSRSSKPSTTSQSRRKPGLSVSSTTPNTLDVAPGKENFDPFHLGGNGVGKKPLMMKKEVVKNSLKPKPPSFSVFTDNSESKSSSSTTTNNPSTTKPARAPAAGGAASQPAINSNEICTGTLRTRVLPAAAAFALPPLPPRTSALPPPRRFQSLSVTSSTSSTCPSPAVSAVDSGYARSDATDTEEEDEDGDDIEMNAEDKTVRLVDVGAPETPSSVVGGKEDHDDDFNRRARALTESPLAEVTEAYTGHGNFALPNSPLNSSPPRRPATRRIRSSPTHSPTKPAASSAVAGARPKPYTTKSSSSVKSLRDVDDLTRSIKTLRF